MIRILKSLFFLFQFTLLVNFAMAQGDFNIKKFQEQVEMIDGQVNKLFQRIDRPLYSNYQHRSKYEKYALEAREMLSDLDKLEKNVKQISSEYSSDRDFYIRWANLNICQLKIRRHKETILSHLKFNNDPQVYEDSIVVWTKEEGLNLKELKRQIERLKAIDSGNIYATIIEGIAAFFEGRNELASSKIESALKVASNKTNSKMSDDELDQLFGFCSSWKAYLSFINKDFSAFNDNLTNCIASKGPTSSISWAIDSKRALDEQKKEGTIGKSIFF